MSWQQKNYKHTLTPKTNLYKAYSNVRDYGKLIAEVSRYLNNSPYKMTISDVDVSFPIVGEREYTLNGKIWPTAQQLAKVLTDYLSKRVKAKHLYDSLSDSQRQTIEPHPDI